VKDVANRLLLNNGNWTEEPSFVPSPAPVVTTHMLPKNAKTAARSLKYVHATSNIITAPFVQTSADMTIS